MYDTRMLCVSVYVEGGYACKEKMYLGIAWMHIECMYGIVF